VSVLGFGWFEFLQSGVLDHPKNLDNSIIGLFCETLNKFSTILVFSLFISGIYDFCDAYTWHLSGDLYLQICMGFKSHAYCPINWKFSRLTVVLYKKTFIIYSTCKIFNYLSIHLSFLVKLHHFNLLHIVYYNFNLCLYIIIYFSGPPGFFFGSATEFHHR
jgi:hypothetical protein